MSIRKRVVFYDNTRGFVRFWDWALVTTSLGTMAELFQPGLRFATATPHQEYDPEDPMARIDEMRAVDRNEMQRVLGGGDHHLMGGVSSPLTGP